MTSDQGLAPTRDGRPQSPLALVASADEWFARALEVVLEAMGVAVVRARTAREVVALASVSSVHAIVLDAERSSFPFDELCTSIRAVPGTGAATPLVLVRLRPWTPAARLGALRAGAWECLAIPSQAEELRAKLTTYMEARSQLDHAREGGLLDPLTDAYNATGILRRAQELGAEANRYARPIGCLAIAAEPVPTSAWDTDPAAPAIATAHLLRRTVRASDAVGRVGSLEFMIVAPNAGPTGISRLAERVLAAVDGPGATAGQPRLRTGYFAVQDLRASQMEPVELVARASSALKEALAFPRGDQDDPSVPAPSRTLH